MATKSAKQTIIFCVGSNCDGDLGLGHNDKQHQLTESDLDPSITKVYAFPSVAIFSNDDHSKLWASGANWYGQLGIGKKISDINTPKPITYFKKNQIKIAKICQYNDGNCIYYITNKGQLYYTGQNHTKTTNHYEPIPVTELENVIDAQSSGTYSVALCQSNAKEISLIISFWCRIYEIPSDLREQIMAFTKYNTVFATNDHGMKSSDKSKETEDPDKREWNEIDLFRKENINGQDCCKY